MATLSVKDIISSAIGDNNATTDESGNTSYGAWSPNSVRSLIVSSGFVLVEWFPGSSMAKARKGRFTIKEIKAPLGYFDGENRPDPISPVLKKYGYRNIEEIIVDSKYGCSASSLAGIQLKGATNANAQPSSTSKYADAATVNADSSSKVSETAGWGTIRGNMGNTRLRSVTVIDFPQLANPMQFLDQLSKYRSQCDSGQTDGVNSLTSVLVREGLPVVDSVSLYPENDNTYLNCFTLSPSRYDADSKDKGLCKYLMDSANVSENEGAAGSEDSAGKGDAEDDFDESLFHTILKESGKALDVAKKYAKSENKTAIPDDKLQSIVKLLQFVTSHKKDATPPDDMQITSKSLPLEGHGVFCMDDQNKISMVKQCSVELFGGAPSNKGYDDKSLASWYEGIVGRIKHDYPGLFDGSILKDNSDSSDEDNKGSFDETKFYSMLKALAAAKERVEEDAEIDEYEQSELLTAMGIVTAHNEGMSLPAELPINSDEEDLGGSGVFGMDSDAKIEGFSDAVADLLGGCDDIPEDRSDSSLLKWYDAAAKGLYRKYPQYFQSKKDSEEVKDSKEDFDELFYPVISQAIAAAKSATGINAGKANDESKDANRLPKYDKVIGNGMTVKAVLLKLFASISSHVKGQSIPDEFKNASAAVTLSDDGSDKNWHGAFFMDSEYKVNEVKTLYIMLKGKGAPDVQFPALPATDETKDALKAAYQGILDDLSQEYPAAFGGEESGIEDIVYSQLRVAIDTKVEVVLKSYDSIFAAGYDLERPYSILGRGDIQYTSLQGGIIGPQKNSDIERVVVYLWNNISGYMGIVPSQISSMRDYKEVAEAPAGTYMPTLMASMAYGYYLHDPEKGHEPRHTGIHDWSEYRTKIVKPFLKKVFMRSAVNAANKIGATDVNSIAAHSLDITNAMDPVMDNLQKCILVSNLKISKSSESTKFVSMKVKILAPKSADEDSKVESIRKGVLDAVAEATDEEIKKKGKTIAEHDGRYIEITFVADQVQDNVFPLFAYKALDALHEQNKKFEPGINSVLLGKDSNGRLLKAGEKINFNNTFTHYILAKSRAGKGVMTLNILAGCMDGVTPLAYADNKPDMLSLLRWINPNVYGINGEALNYGGGNDLFNQFEDINSEVNWDNVPEYLVKNGYVSRSYKGVGNIFYLRFMMLTMGIIIARVDTRQFRDILGGEHGITVVFDEFANTTTTFKNLCSMWNTKLAPKNQIKAVKNELKKGSSLEEAMDSKGTELNPGMFWATAYLQSIKDSVTYLQTKNNAGLNADKMYDNIFVLGQHALNLDSKEGIDMPDLHPSNAGSRVMGLTPDVAENMVTYLTRAGDADAFLGASEAGDDFLCASIDKAEKANTYLNERARGFAYIENIGAADAFYKKAGSASDAEKIAFSNKQLYFKPFLLLEESEMEKYPVSNMLTFMRKSVTEQDVKDFVALNSKENDPKALNDGVSFLGYLDKAHISREDVSNQLQKTADMANWVVQKGLGYPGTWREFVYDLRPQWIFSAKNICEALSKSSNAADMSASVAWFNSDERIDSVLKDMRELYPDYMPDFSKEDSKDYMGNLSDLEAGFGDSVGEDYNSGDTTTTSEDSAPTQVIPPVQPAAFAPDQQPVGIPVNPFDNMEMPVAADTTPVDEMQLVTNAIINKFAVTQGGALEANLRGIKICGQPLQVNGVAQPQDKVNWAELLRKGYVAELDTTSNYINQYIAPAMGWGKCSVDTFFKESPALSILTVDGKQYSRMEATQPQSAPQPVVESWQDPKSALNGSSMGSTVLIPALPLVSREPPTTCSRRVLIGVKNPSAMVEPFVRVQPQPWVLRA